jgi:hypothetical protein
MCWWRISENLANEVSSAAVKDKSPYVEMFGHGLPIILQLSG